ncbi:hypothetical protein NX059_008322 [Plenodomus lindquistii]|nr:hypothetical protein NX059_008322 [Plenodomus lindquistii]
MRILEIDPRCNHYGRLPRSVVGPPSIDVGKPLGQNHRENGTQVRTTGDNDPNTYLSDGPHQRGAYPNCHVNTLVLNLQKRANAKSSDDDRAAPSSAVVSKLNVVC